MGQYNHIVNLDKKEWINPHEVGAGLKQWEILANHPGVGAALIILIAWPPERRGGGDFDIVDNWHGPERKFPEYNTKPGPMPDDYKEIAWQTIGRWAGDRIIMVGDYAEDSDMPSVPGFGSIYTMCYDGEYGVGLCLTQGCTNYGDHLKLVDEETLTFECPGGCGKRVEGAYRNITPYVAKVIEHELNGQYEGDGWRHFVYDRDREQETGEQPAE